MAKCPGEFNLFGPKKFGHKIEIKNPDNDAIM